jgi:hypothetical protein
MPNCSTDGTLDLGQGEGRINRGADQRGSARRSARLEYDAKLTDFAADALEARHGVARDHVKVLRSEARDLEPLRGARGFPEQEPVRLSEVADVSPPKSSDMPSTAASRLRPSSANGANGTAERREEA